jgi:hypothetical protein
MSYISEVSEPEFNRKNLEKLDLLKLVKKNILIKDSEHPRKNTC